MSSVNRQGSHPAFDLGGEKGAPSRRCAVLLPLPLAGAYDYSVPADLAVAPGDMVAVPLGTRLVGGVVWGPALGDVAEAKLKPLAGRLAAPPLGSIGRRLVDWMAD